MEDSSTLDQEQGEWLWNFGGDELVDDDVDETVCASWTREELVLVIARIGTSEGSDLIHDLKKRASLVTANMGSLQLCQVDYRGELLRELGVIDSLLSTLFSMRHYLSSNPTSSLVKARDETTKEAFHLATVSWKALRELACGSIGNRTAIRMYSQDCVDGLELIVSYLKAYHEVPWEDMDDTELNLVTAVIGVLRNVSHKTPENCIPLFEYGAAPLLIWRLLSSEQSDIGASLPEQRQPWREACFRCAGTLLNIAEEHMPCVEVCSTNPLLVAVLVESWGTNKRLSDVLRALLVSAKAVLPADTYDAKWEALLLC